MKKATITLIGAGGKMGCRIADNFLKRPELEVCYVENSPRSRENLQRRNVETTEASVAVPSADVVILAVPDIVIGQVAREFVPQMKPGALLMTLDPAAPLDGQLPERPDIGCVIAHPCHPSVFNWETTEAAFRDFYGGISAKQPIVCALMHGTEQDYDRGVEIATAMYAPVSRVHRVTLEQMAILEPAMVETLSQTCMEVVREGYDEIVRKGVPAAAARDFVLGHLRIQIAVLFNEVNGTFSDAAYKISRRARPVLFREGWKQIFDHDDIRAQVREIAS